jgi:hypothetical protein
MRTRSVCRHFDNRRYSCAFDLGAGAALRNGARLTAAARMEAGMATAVFADDRLKLDYTVAAYKNGFTDAP